MEDKLIKVDTSALSTEKETSINEIQAKASKLPPDDPLNLLFGKGNDFAIDVPTSTGYGSFSGMKLKNEDGSLVDHSVSGTTKETLKEQATHIVQHPAFPLLRYINLPGGSIEIRIHKQTRAPFKFSSLFPDTYSASRTLDGVKYKELCSKVGFEELLAAITSRSRGWVEPKVETKQLKLEDSTELDTANSEGSISDVQEIINTDSDGDTKNVTD